MSDRIPASAIEGLSSQALGDFSTTPPTAGQTPVWDESTGQYTPGDPNGADALATAKGDLLAAITSGQLGALHVGPDGQVLTADASQTLGVKWAAPTATGGGGDGTTGDLLVLDGVVPLEPVGSDTDPTVWLYGDAGAGGAGGGVTDHGSLTGLGDDDHPQYVKGQTGRSYRLLAGILRKDGGSWFLINDANHRPLGLGAVTADSSQVHVAVTLGATMVGTVLITPDETYAVGEWAAGASVQKTALNITITKAGVAQNPLTMPDQPTGNFWIFGLMEAP